MPTHVWTGDKLQDWMSLRRETGTSGLSKDGMTPPHMLFQNFAHLHQEMASNSLSLESRKGLWLSWHWQYSRNEAVWLTRLGPERQCSFCLVNYYGTHPWGSEPLCEKSVAAMLGGSPSYTEASFAVVAANWWPNWQQYWLPDQWMKTPWWLLPWPLGHPNL